MGVVLLGWGNSPYFTPVLLPLRSPMHFRSVAVFSCTRVWHKERGWFWALALAVGCLYPANLISAERNSGLASWYGEPHRDRLMANGDPFDPGKCTAASWFYPLGTKLRITLQGNDGTRKKSVVVTVTDRGPAMRLVREGRVIDLAEAAFKRLADPEVGLVKVRIQPVR